MGELKNLASLLLILVVIFFLQGINSGRAIAQYTLPRAPQELGMMEKPYSDYQASECIACHLAPGELTTANLHHNTPTVLQSGCIVCHPVNPATGKLEIGADFDRNCLRCHYESSHHQSNLAKVGLCASCHDANLVAHVGTGLNPPEAPTYAVSPGTPTISSCRNCHTEFNPVLESQYVASPQRLSHHYASQECGFCHDNTSPAGIRVCESCHTISTLHKIKGHTENPDYCSGCHEQGVLPGEPVPPVIVPVIGAVDSSFGLPGRLINLSGEYLGSGLPSEEYKLYFKSRDAAGQVFTVPTTSWSFRNIAFQVPDLVSGNYSISIETPDGPSNVKIFTIMEEPQITKIMPGNLLPGDIATIQGEGFAWGDVVVIFTQGSQQYSLVPLTRDQNGLMVRLPNDLPLGQYQVVVRTDGGMSKTVTCWVGTEPRGIGMTPVSGKAGTTFNIYGHNLYYPQKGKPTVIFDKCNVQIVSYSANRIIAKVPPLKPGKKLVKVSNGVGTSYLYYTIE